jgi:hypothetical protein
MTNKRKKTFKASSVSESKEETNESENEKFMANLVLAQDLSNKFKPALKSLNSIPDWKNDDLNSLKFVAGLIGGTFKDIVVDAIKTRQHCDKEEEQEKKDRELKEEQERRRNIFASYLPSSQIEGVLSILPEVIKSDWHSGQLKIALEGLGLGNEYARILSELKEESNVRNDLNIIIDAKVSGEENISSVVNIKEIYGHSDKEYMFVRPVYYKSYTEGIQLLEKTNVCYCGDPGIGKSVMSLYFFYCLMKEGKNVIRISEDGSWLNYDGQNATTGTYEVACWKEKGYYLLLDGKAPDKYLGKRSRTAIFASPSKENYYKFIKTTEGTMRYVEPWSLEELGLFVVKMSDEIINSLQLSELNDESFELTTQLQESFPVDFNLKSNDWKDSRNKVYSVVLKRFNVVGGRLRYIFHCNETFKSLEALVNRAVVNVSPEELENMTLIDIKDYVPSIIYSIIPTETRNSFYLKFASETVVRFAMSRMVFSRRREAKNIYMFIHDAGIGHSFQGQMFECLANYAISQGGYFNVRELDNNTESESTVEEPNLLDSLIAFSNVGSNDFRILNLPFPFNSKSRRYEVNVRKMKPDTLNKHLLKTSDSIQMDQSFLSMKAAELDEIRKTHCVTEHVSGNETSPKKGVIHLEPANVKYFHDINNADLSEGVYNVPFSRYMPVLDAILSFNLVNEDFVAMCQMTVGQQHPIRSSRASEYYSCLQVKSGEKAVILLFVVPSHRYDSFTLQETGDLKCRQFVMEVPIEDTCVKFADSVDLPELA